MVAAPTHVFFIVMGEGGIEGGREGERKRERGKGEREFFLKFILVFNAQPTRMVISRQ